MALAADRQPTPEAGDPRLNNSNNTVLGGLGLPSRCACVCVSSTQHLSTFAHVRVFLFWTGPCDTHVYMSRDIGRQWRGACEGGGLREADGRRLADRRDREQILLSGSLDTHDAASPGLD